jgi:hypothetical protein
MQSLMSALRRRAADERGFTMIVAMGAVLVVSMLSVAAFAAANGDIHTGAVNADQKDAYAAAEAGVADYQYHLNQNPDFWRKCNVGTGTARISQPWNGTGADTRALGWRPMPNSNAEYAIELLPAVGTKCDTANPDGTMINKSTGTFQIRVTGRMVNDKSVKRSVIATFKRTGFLDFLWFTDLEDQDPTIWTKLNSCQGTPSTGTGTVQCYATTPTKTLDNWAANQCALYWRQNRGTTAYPGQYLETPGDNKWHNLPRNCTEIVYGDNENLLGPIHTNDGLNMCGTPTFGRGGTASPPNPPDRLEVSASAKPDESPRRANLPGCTDNAKINGTWLPGSPRLDPPQTNASLKNDADLLFTGGTKIVFKSDGTMDVTNHQQTPRTKNMAVPKDAVIYIQSGPAGVACSPYDPFNPFVYDGTAADGCGDLSVQGTYTQNLTIAADSDIVITDDLTRLTGSDYLMGLIANNFVRIAHPSLWDSSGSALWQDVTGAQAPECKNVGTTTKDITVNAAILALNHQFTVDRYGCGAGLGTLTIKGAIAQKWRGPVGIGNGTTGFIKNYSYDDYFKYRSPPKFLNPVNVAWNVARQVEQSPAT